MVGPPGSGKSMMAKRLPSILPPLTLQESLETTKIHSVNGMMPDRIDLQIEIVLVPFEKIENSTRRTGSITNVLWK